MFSEADIRNFASPLSQFLKSLGYTEKPLRRTDDLNYYEIEFVNDDIVVDDIVEFAKQYLMELITGRSWETIHVDWGPYK